MAAMEEEIKVIDPLPTYLSEGDSTSAVLGASASNRSVRA